jgi:hypothetical protein
MTSNNIYIDKIIELSNDSPQTAEYILIVSNARIRASTKNDAISILGYTEEHHILPKSFKMGGATDKLNYAYLSAREHYRAHQLLLEMGLKRNLHEKMIHAFWLLCIDGKHKFISEEEYRELKILRSDNHNMKDPECIQKRRDNNLENTGFTHPMKNPECKEKSRNTNLEKTGYDNPMQNPECKEKKKRTLEIKYSRPLVIQIEQDIEKYNIINPRKIMGIKCTDWRQVDYEKLEECSVNFYKFLDERKIKIKEYECRINEISSAFKSIDDKQSLMDYIIEIKDFYNIPNHTGVMEVCHNWKRLNVIKLQIALGKLLKHTIDKFYMN